MCSFPHDLLYLDIILPTIINSAVMEPYRLGFVLAPTSHAYLVLWCKQSCPEQPTPGPPLSTHPFIPLHSTPFTSYTQWYTNLLGDLHHALSSTVKPMDAQQIPAQPGSLRSCSITICAATGTSMEK